MVASLSKPTPSSHKSVVPEFRSELGSEFFILREPLVGVDHPRLDGY